MPENQEEQPYQAPPMGWDLAVPRTEAAVRWLAEVGEDDETRKNRVLAAALLVEDWEKRCDAPPDLIDLLVSWWVAVRQVCDVAARAGHPGRSAGFVFQQLMYLNAAEFADTLGMEVKDYVVAMDEAGFPRPDFEDEVLLSLPPAA